MKTQGILFVAFLLTTVVGLAQDCGAFFPFEKGATIGYAFYDAKGKLTSSSEQKVVIIDDKGAAGMQAQVETINFDKNGKESTKGTFEVKCKDGNLYMDITSIMAPQMTESFAQMEMTVTGDGLQLPAKLEIGQSLPDASAEFKAASGGINIMTMKMDVVERKVVGKEVVATGLGSYECYKISYTTNVKMLVNKSFTTIAWFAPKVGMVKSEVYNKKGTLESLMELTKFQKS